MALELNYSALTGQESMLSDAIRCRAFQEAIEAAVTPGCTVLDIGAGTGILSMFAVQAGAAKVYAVEQTRIAEVAKLIIEENSMSDCIEVIQGDITAVDLPEKVDVIISEWLGSYAFDENLLPIVIDARDRFLKPGGKMVPESVTVWMAPAFDEYLQQDLDFWRSDPYGINLEFVSRSAACRMDCFRNGIKEKHLLCKPQLMWDIDCLTCSKEEVNAPFHFKSRFAVEQDGEFNVVTAWFRANLSDGIMLCNGPSDPDTHWGRQIFPVGKNIFIEKGSVVDVDFTHEPHDKGESHSTWSVKTGDYDFSSKGITVLSV